MALVSDPEVIQLVSCSTQLSMNFQMVMKTKTPKNKDFAFVQTLSFVYLSC